MEKLITLLCSLALFALGAKAQVTPLESSESAPVWYYIEVTDGTSGEKLVCTVEDNLVYGRQAVSTDADAASSQLWRFESAGDGLCYVINKSTGTSLTMKYLAAKQANALCVSSMGAKFKVEADGQLIRLRANAVTDDCYYAGLAAKADLDGLFIMQTDEESKVNGSLQFSVFNDSPITLSTKGNEVWYSIVPVKEGLDGMALTEASGETGGYPVMLETLAADNQAQQWKFVEEETSGRIMIASRKNGLHILPSSYVSDGFNITAMGWVAKYRGFDFKYLGLGQYAIAGTEDDDVVRYLGLQNVEGESLELGSGNLINTDFAWKFKQMGTGTGVDALAAGKLQVRVANGRIVVDGADNWQVVSALGMEMPKDAKLQKGVYIVTADGQSVKVTIK